MTNDLFTRPTKTEDTDVQPLSPKQMGGVFLGAALVHLFIYLNAKAAPDEVPDDSDEPAAST